MSLCARIVRTTLPSASEMHWKERSQWQAVSRKEEEAGGGRCSSAKQLAWRST